MPLVLANYTLSLSDDHPVIPVNFTSACSQRRQPLVPITSFQKTDITNSGPSFGGVSLRWLPCLPFHGQKKGISRAMARQCHPEWLPFLQPLLYRWAAAAKREEFQHLVPNFVQAGRACCCFMCKATGSCKNDTRAVRNVFVFSTLSFHQLSSAALSDPVPPLPIPCQHTVLQPALTSRP